MPIRVGFCMVQTAPQLGEAVLNLSDNDQRSIELRSQLSQGVNMQPTRKHPVTGERQELVVGLRAEGNKGYYTEFLYTSSFSESVPEFLIMNESVTPIFYLVQRLRITYGGNLQFGPWPSSCSVLKGPVKIKNLPTGLSSDCNYGLSDAVEIDGRPFAEKVYLVKQLEKLSAIIFPEDKILRLHMLDQKHHNNIMTLDDNDCIVTVAERFGGQKQWNANKEEESKTDTNTAFDSAAISVCSSLIPRRMTRKKQLRPLAEMIQSDVIPSTSAIKVPAKNDKIPKAVKLASGELKCPKCTYKSKDRSNMSKHIKTHFRLSSSYKCNICGAVMTDWSNFNVHCRRHEGNESFICDICGKAFTANCNLAAHKKVHSQTHVKFEGACALPSCSKYKTNFKDLLKHLKLCHTIYTFIEYKNELIKQLQLKQSGAGACHCPNHKIWIHKFVGQKHNCYLCDCSYTWDRVPTVYNKLTIWNRACKFAMYVIPSLIEKVKLNP